MHTYQDNKRRHLGLGQLSPKDIHLKSAAVVGAAPGAAPGGGGALPLLWSDLSKWKEFCQVAMLLH